MQTSLAQFATETSDLVERLRRCVVMVSTARGQASGVVWAHDGLIVTNHHVLAGHRAEVERADGRRLVAAVAARDERQDLALLQVAESADDLIPALIGDSTALRVGELVLAVGNPFGVRGNATLGIVSAIGSRTWMGQAQRELLQADIALAPGNSGGPLADTEGRIVGIASMILSPGIAIAIPSHVVSRFVEETRKTRL